MEMVNKYKILPIFWIIFISPFAALADDEAGVKTQAAAGETTDSAIIQTAQQIPAAVDAPLLESITYTLGPEDIIEIFVQRHPEFSGTFPISNDGKIQYKFAGDIDANGLTKKELEEKIEKIISNYVINPEVNVTLLEYKSKVIYVLGEVTTPGKYYMKSDRITVREAVVSAGLPSVTAAMRRCRLITPAKNGKVKTRTVDLYTVLYGGDLRRNLEMQAGDVLYVPATIMAKVVRVISPVTATVGVSSAGPESASTGREAVTSLAR